MVNDSVGDFIVRIKNATAVQKDRVTVPYSKFRHAVADKLSERGYVGEVTKRGKKVRRYLEVALAYHASGEPRVHGVKRVSKPGRRVYTKASDIHPVRHGKGSLIVSTPNGVLTGEEARKENAGGEVLFEIW